MSLTRITILIGDVFERLSELPDGTVHACVTSPPYWGLRSYLPDDSPLKAQELGSEPTPEAWAARQVEVFREVRRVLRQDGTLWLNVGDCYCQNTKWGGRSGGKNEHSLAGGISRRRNDLARYKPGDRISQGPMLCEALRLDGWHFVQEYIWAKGASFGDGAPGTVMPESVNGWRWERCRVKVGKSKRAKKGSQHAAAHAGVNQPQSARDGVNFRDQSKNYRDCPGCPKCAPNDGWVLRRSRWRGTNAFERVYQLAAGKRPYGDREAVAERWADARHGDPGAADSKYEVAGVGACSRRYTDRRYTAPQCGGRNLRNVWRINTRGYKGSHYATFPPDLVVPCIKASTPEKGVCPTCGAPWARMVETNPGYQKAVPDGWDGEQGGARMAKGAHPATLPAKNRTVGWRPTCEHAGKAIPATVIDPYGGSGTVGEVAAGLGRNAILIDLDPRNERLMRKRLRSVALFAEVTTGRTEAIA